MCKSHLISNSSRVSWQESHSNPCLSCREMSPLIISSHFFCCLKITFIYLCVWCTCACHGAPATMLVYRTVITFRSQISQPCGFWGLNIRWVMGWQQVPLMSSHLAGPYHSPDALSHKCPQYLWHKWCAGDKKYEAQTILKTKDDERWKLGKYSFTLQVSFFRYQICFM